MQSIYSVESRWKKIFRVSCRIFGTIHNTTQLIVVLKTFFYCFSGETVKTLKNQQNCTFFVWWTRDELDYDLGKTTVNLLYELTKSSLADNRRLSSIQQCELQLHQHAIFHCLRTWCAYFSILWHVATTTHGKYLNMEYWMRKFEIFLRLNLCDLPLPFFLALAAVQKCVSMWQEIFGSQFSAV